MTRELAELMRDATDDLPEVDLADVTWERARRARSARLLTVGAAASVAAVALVGAVALGSSSSQPHPAPVARTSTPAPISPDLKTVAVEGATVDLAPDPDAMSRLPRLQPAALGLPELPGFDAGTRIERFGGPLRARMTMVLLRVVEPERSWRPVLYVVDASANGRYLEVPVTLQAADDGHGNAAVPLSPRAVSEDGRRVAFAQPGEVVVVDVADTGSVTRHQVPGGLTQAGWDGETIVLSSDTTQARLDPATGRHTSKAVGITVADPPDEKSAIEGRVGIAPYRIAGEREADAVWLTAGALDGGRHQGVAVMTWPRRVLAASPDRQVPKLGLRPLGWSGPEVLLVGSTSYAGATRTERILAWDLGGSTLQRVADVGPVSSAPGGFSGHYVLGPVPPQ